MAAEAGRHFAVCIYLYANADPVGHMDPSGHETLLEAMLTVDVVGELANIATPRLVVRSHPPAVTSEAFIKDKYIMGGSFGPFMGDNRGFTEHPAGIDRSRYTLTTENGGAPYGLQNETHLPFGIGGWAGNPVYGGAVKETVSGVYQVNMFIIARDPYGLGMAPAVSNSVDLKINTNTGLVAGSVRHTSYPSLQVFVNGASVLKFDQNVILGAFTMSTDKVSATLPLLSLRR